MEKASLPLQAHHFTFIESSFKTVLAIIDYYKLWKLKSTEVLNTTRETRLLETLSFQVEHLTRNVQNESSMTIGYGQLELELAGRRVSDSPRLTGLASYLPFTGRLFCFLFRKAGNHTFVLQPVWAYTCFL